MAIFGISFKNNKEQAELVRLIMQKDLPIIFGIGKAGTGKNFAALTCALHLQDNNEYAEIYYGRNPIQCGEPMGFMPGDIEGKYYPFMRPLETTLKSIVSTSSFWEKKSYKERCQEAERLAKNISVVPIAFLRGDTFNNAVVIIDECQNLDMSTLQTIMTRLGKYAKLVLLGSYNQIDDPKQARKEKCDFQRVVEAFMAEKPYCGFVELKQSMRSEICVDIDETFEKLKKQ